MKKSSLFEMALIVLILFGASSSLGHGEEFPIEEWVARYNGPGNSYDFAHAIAVDSSGNVYVTGSSYGVGTDDDYATVKYDTYGNELWVRRYNGPGNNLDVTYAIAIDSEGNVYVTGSSYGSGTGYDYATVKYDTYGNELWVRRYNGPGNSYDLAYAIAVDSSGNVYVTGHSYSNYSRESDDYATVKYDTNGTQLWVARYNSPGNNRDVAYAIAIDSSGNVYVTGGSVGNGTNWDYATVKYSFPVEEIRDSILNLPDYAFLPPAAQRKNAFSKLLDVVSRQINNGNFQGAINILEKNILAKMDGYFGGNPHDDWIIDQVVQQEVYPMILFLIEKLKAML